MKKLLFLILCLCLNLTLFSHPWKPGHYVIIDTDGGIDDIRTLAMLLASPDVRVLAVTISPGALGTGNAYIKVRSLLDSFRHEGIPVGVNRKCNFKSPEFEVALNSIWGNENGVDAAISPDCIPLIKDIFLHEKTTVSFICLAGLSTVSMAIEEIPEFNEKVKEIIWSSEGRFEKSAFNYKIDSQSAEKVIKNGISLKAVTSLSGEVFYTEPAIRKISEIPTVYAGKIAAFFNSADAAKHKYSYSATDEMVAVYLHYPTAFQRDTLKDIYQYPLSEMPALREYTYRILAGETVEKNQVIKIFPSDPDFYSADVKPFVSQIILKYGTDEWTSAVITNELHRHLGVFSIIGVKMGIRAREFFDTGVDEFSTVSFAGSNPPLSCINDGLQVSTGSTPGHGLLTVINDTPALPSAEFKYMNHRIRLTLKPQIAEKIASELKEINFVYGLDSNIYWELVRKNSLNYWRDLDRHEIFDIEVIN
jgi:pyrimidine-specific ribonucleoside hydrolase